MPLLDMATRSTLRSAPLPALHLSGARRTLVQSAPVRTEPTDPTSNVAKQAAKNGETPVSWNEYLQLRKQRRIAGVVATWPTTLLAGVGSGMYLTTHELPFTFAGLDPMVISGLGLLVGTGAGLLAGPALGSVVWAWINRAKANTIAQKDKAFFEHVRKNRVDPSMQSVQNPIPDFYGEKIGSLHEYRQWLRDQNTYRRKVSYGVKQDE